MVVLPPATVPLPIVTHLTLLVFRCAPIHASVPIMRAQTYRPLGSFSVVVALWLIASPAGAFPPGPTPVVPDGGGAPGAYPNTSVTAVNVLARGSSTDFNGNVEITGFEGQGPIPWTITKYNRGDFAMRLAPANPTAANANTLNQGFIDFTAAANAALPENQSWRPHPLRGVAIPTARQNGPINWNDGQPEFFPTVAISAASSGQGYNMIDGTFGTGQLDINTGRAGGHGLDSPEANFSFSVAWFPYDAGWIGGNVGNPDATTGAPSWAGAGEHATGLIARNMTWSQFPPGSGTYGGLGMLQLPGIDAVTNGMIFTTSSDGASDVNIVGVAPVTNGNATAWLVTIREDSELAAEAVAGAGQHEFEFVYIPYNASNLIGGFIEGITGDSLQSAGTYTMERVNVGTYSLAIPGKAASSGTLLLQVADIEEGTSVPMASKAMLSYQYNSGSGRFIIESRKAIFDGVVDLFDASFYFAWIDFTNPPAPPTGPRLRSRDAVVVADSTVIKPKEGNLAVNTDEPEILITTIDTSNANAYIDPTVGIPAIEALVGYFHDPRTLERTRGPFFIMGNSQGSGLITRHDVKYNPVSHQYVVVGCARAYESGVDLVMISLVNPHSVAGGNEPRADTFVYDGLSNGLSYDDVSVAVSPRNGNFIVVAEHKVAAPEGEGCYGALFRSDGTPLTLTPTRLDLLQGTGDEDDPDVIYLPKKDAFLYISNTDAAGLLVNRIVGTVIQTTNNPAGELVLSGVEQSLSANSGPAQGHPASIENPFNGEIITAFDTGGNDVSTGELSYYNIGAPPSYPFTQARPQVPYLAGPAGGNPFRHQHPQIAVDPNSGAMVIGYQARGSSLGLPNAYVFSVLDTNGIPMPSQMAVPYFLIDAAAGPIDTGVNYHNIKYDASTDSFLAVATAGAAGARSVYLGSVTVTSSHLPPRPSLTIQRSGSNVIIRWPASATGYVLKSTASLTSPTWTTVPGTVAVNGGFREMTVPISGNAFFRLEL